MSIGVVHTNKLIFLGKILFINSIIGLLLTIISRIPVDFGLFDILPIFVVGFYLSIPIWLPIFNIVLIAFWNYIIINNFTKKELFMLIIGNVVTIVLWLKDPIFTNLWLTILIHIAIRKRITKKEFFTILCFNLGILTMTLVKIQWISNLTSNFLN